jgi:nitronate monooxygenase
MEAIERAAAFGERYGMRLPVVMAPMAGACPPELAAAVADAGGMGAAGSVLDRPEAIAAWAERFRAASSGPFQLNLWIPDPDPDDDGAAASAFLRSRSGEPGEAGPPAPSFAEQCDAVVEATPTAVSSIMGVFPPDVVERIHARGLAWFACATTLAEALAAQEAGADAVVAQGIEAGGHRGTTDPADAATTGVGLCVLVPALADALDVPVIAAGGIADGRGVAAALLLGASAVQVGTAYLRTPEAGVPAAWSDALAAAAPETSVLTRAYSGRPGRALPTPFVRAWTGGDAPPPAPYPVQRRLVGQWRREAGEVGDDGVAVDAVNQWAGQASALARAEPAGAVTERLWSEARALLGA